MVKVLMPLGSLHASGTIAKAITFASTRGIQYARVNRPQRNPKTAGQIGFRAGFGFMSKQASTFTPEEEEAWREHRGRTGLTARNSAVSDAQERGRQGLPPRRSPLDPDETLSDAAILSAVQAFRASVWASWTGGLLLPSFCWQLYRQTTPGVTKSTYNRIAVLDFNKENYIDTFAQFTGLLYYAIAPVTLAGQEGPLSNEVEVLVE